MSSESDMGEVYLSPSWQLSLKQINYATAEIAVPRGSDKSNGYDVRSGIGLNHRNDAELFPKISAG